MAQKAPVANGRRNLGITCSTRPQCAKPRKVPTRSPAENGGQRAFVHSSIQTTVPRAVMIEMSTAKFCGSHGQAGAAKSAWIF